MNSSSFVRHLLLCCSVLASIGICSVVASARAPKTAAPQTVVDYFLLLPDKYCAYMSSADRRERLTDKRNTLDVKNDYLYVQGGDSQGGLCIVLFRHAGRVVVAVQDEGYDPPEPSLDFLRFEHGHWKNVTKQILDVYDADDLDPYERNTFQLPRYGSTIHVLNSVGFNQYDLVWKNGRFQRANDKG